MPSELIFVLVIMILAAICVWGFKRIQLPPILAYLVAGFIAGPSLLNFFPHSAQMHIFAEVGIVFLLFSLGLEFSLPKLIAMRNLVFGVGLAQMTITTTVVAFIGNMFGLSVTASIVLGGMVGLSSTAIVIKQTSEMKILNTPRSQIAVAVLLFQDLAVVPFLIIIPLLGESGDVSIIQTILLSLGKGILVIAGLLWFGRLVLPIIFREVASTRTDELFVLTTIIVALGAAGLTYGMGLSLALGAFLAGMMLSESRYRFQIEADIRPFRDILMGLFFITVGMRLEWSLIWPNTHWIAIGLIVLLATKILLFRFSTFIFKTPSTDAWSAAFKLSQMGEFSFILAALAVTYNVFSADFSGIIVSIGVVSMALTPFMVNNSYAWAQKLTIKDTLSHQDLPLRVRNKDFQNHVILLGFGRVGQSAAKMLTMENIKYVAIDIDPIRVQEALQGSEDIIFGDVGDMSILRAAFIEQAAAVVLTFDETHKAQQSISKIREHFPKLPVIVRTKRDYDLDKLYAVGASQVVPELQEASLMLVSQIYHYCGIPISRILKRVQAERKHRYNHLHGVFPGETTEVNFEKEDKLQFLHAVSLGASAWAVGKTIEQCDCQRHSVNVYSIRRGENELIQPEITHILEPEDIVVLSGRPRRIERAERKLLYGN